MTRKTLAQMQQEALGGDYACPRCGCKDWRGEKNSEVERTLHPNGGSTVRKRICRNCKQARFDTHEVVVPPGCKVLVVDEEEERPRACA